MSLDPKSVALCTAVTPKEKAFVPCSPVTKLGGTLYADRADLVTVKRALQTSATLTVRHPKFDLDDARAKAMVITGEFGYERTTQRWILVDGARSGGG